MGRILRAGMLWVWRRFIRTTGLHDGFPVCIRCGRSDMPFDGYLNSLAPFSSDDYRITHSGDVITGSQKAICNACLELFASAFATRDIRRTLDPDPTVGERWYIQLWAPTIEAHWEVLRQAWTAMGNGLRTTKVTGGDLIEFDRRLLESLDMLCWVDPDRAATKLDGAFKRDVDRFIDSEEALRLGVVPVVLFGPDLWVLAKSPIAFETVKVVSAMTKRRLRLWPVAPEQLDGAHARLYSHRTP